MCCRIRMWSRGPFRPGQSSGYNFVKQVTTNQCLKYKNGSFRIVIKVQCLRRHILNVRPSTI